MTRYSISSLPSYVGSGEAQALLGVRRQTRYAYGSPRLIRAQPEPDNPRQRVYNAQDLVELAKQHTRSRARRDVAASAIDFGDAVLTSAITRLGEDGHVYRGLRAIDLAESASLEEVAGVLWDGPC